MNLINKKHIGCLIVTYNPSAELYNLIANIKSQVDKIIIVDNNSNQQVLSALIKYSEKENIILMLNKENYGIAKALNQGVVQAKKMNYDWVITFDQDSMPFQNIMEIISEVYFSYPEKQKIGAIGVNFSGLKSDSYYQLPNNKMYCERDYLITSGCLISIKTCIEIGGFREDLFIDDVDLEYSLRLRKNGKVSLITREWGMVHKAGDPIIKRFKGFMLISSNHNSVRRYYKARNHIIISKEYIFKFPYFIAKKNYFFFMSLIHILFIESKKKIKMYSSFKGILDGIFYSSKKRKFLS